MPRQNGALPWRRVWSGVFLLGTAHLSACVTGDEPNTEGDAVVVTTEHLSDAERDARSEKIRQYFKERHARYKVVATTETKGGQILDWIPRESQTLEGKIGEPPIELGRVKQDVAQPERLEGKSPRVLDETVHTELQAEPGLLGPAGTVPIVRFDVERYLETERELPEDPADVLRKEPPPSPASNSRYYGVWQRFGTVYGSAGRINIWDVSGLVSSETSIAQVAVIRGSPMQAIEAGKIETTSQNSGHPRLFTYFRTNGSASGDWVGGYDATVDGWIQYSSSVAPGMSLVGWSSSQGGSQYSLDVTVRLWQGNWWVWAAGEWAGYYPYCKGGGTSAPCSSGTLFSANGIRDQADRLDWYGEVYDKTSPSPTSTDMGSGRFASEGWSHSAYFRNLTYFWAANTYWWWGSGSPSATDSNCYSTSSAFYSSDPNWQNWYYLGGPGKENAACK
jgi:hypothetical protein